MLHALDILTPNSEYDCRRARSNTNPIPITSRCHYSQRAARVSRGSYVASQNASRKKKRDGEAVARRQATGRLSCYVGRLHIVRVRGGGWGEGNGENIMAVIYGKAAPAGQSRYAHCRPHTGHPTPPHHHPPPPCFLPLVSRPDGQFVLRAAQKYGSERAKYIPPALAWHHGTRQ